MFFVEFGVDPRGRCPGDSSNGFKMRHVTKARANQVFSDLQYYQLGSMSIHQAVFREITVWQTFDGEFVALLYLMFSNERVFKNHSALL